MILSGVGGFPMKRVNIRNMRFRLVGALGILMLAAACAAQQAPGPRVVDLTAADGTKLKATFFSAGEPGAGGGGVHPGEQKGKGGGGGGEPVGRRGDYRGRPRRPGQRGREEKEGKA